MNKASKYSLLKKGDTIGLVTPAGFITQKKLDNAIQNLEYHGLKAFYYKSITDKKGYLAGNDKDRALELLKMFKNKTIKAILCVRGGYGSSRITDMLDYDLIKNNPKPFIGYSDITALLFALYKKIKLPGFHGIVGASEFSEYTRNIFNDIFLNSQDTISISQPKKAPVGSYMINSGKTEGILVGGNLSIIISLLGTDYDMAWDDKIIFIEEVNEPPYKIDRMLTQLHQAGKFKKVKGLILGNFHMCEPKDFSIRPEDSLSLKEVILDKITTLKVPSVYGFSFGHIDEQAIFPFGIRIQFNADKFQISFKRQEFQEFF